MTDITSADPTSRSYRAPLRLALPKIAVGAGIGAVASAIGQAFELLYVAPYKTNRQQAHAEVRVDGRDPGW